MERHQGGSKVLCETILIRLKLLMGKTRPNVNTAKSFSREHQRMGQSICMPIWRNAFRKGYLKKGRYKHFLFLRLHKVDKN